MGRTYKTIVFIIPAAGIGSVRGHNGPKQFADIDGRPAILHTVESCLSVRGSSFYVLLTVRVIVIASSEKLAYMHELMDRIPKLLNSNRTRVVCGADSRHKSIYVALQYLRNEGFDSNLIVVIHDGIRPFVNNNNIIDVVKQTEIHHAVGVAQELVSTVISVDEDGMMNEALYRNAYKASEMPQAFELGLILAAYEMCPRYMMTKETDCLDIVRTFTEVHPKILPIDVNNACKITHQLDLHTVRHVAKANQTVCIQNGRIAKKLLTLLVDELEMKFEMVEPNGNFKQFRHSNYVIFHSSRVSEVIDEDERYQINYQSKPLTVVNVTLDGDQQISLQPLQKVARTIADCNSHKNLTSYYVVIEDNWEESTLKKLSRLITSLIYDANRDLSGQIILF